MPNCSSKGYNRDNYLGVHGAIVNYRNECQNRIEEKERQVYLLRRDIRSLQNIVDELTDIIGE